jgi:hypothetical protein
VWGEGRREGARHRSPRFIGHSLMPWIDCVSAAPPPPSLLLLSLSFSLHCPAPMDRDPAPFAGLKLPKSSEQWVVVGVWLAFRNCPEAPFFLSLVDETSGRPIAMQLPDPVKRRSLVEALGLSFLTPGTPLRLRVVQRRDGQGRLFGEVRYLCKDIAASYQTNVTSFTWITHQSVALHASPRMCLCSRSPAACSLPSAPFSFAWCASQSGCV